MGAASATIPYDAELQYSLPPLHFFPRKGMRSQPRGSEDVVEGEPVASAPKIQVLFMRILQHFVTEAHAA